MNYKLKYVYIFLLLVLVSILIFIVQGVYQQETKYTKPVEFNRVDGYNEQLGKISQISVRINNDDAINHNYTVQVLTNSQFFTNETVEVFPGLPFSLSMTLQIEKQYDDTTGLTEGPIQNASFTVYRDDRAKPIDSIEFTFS
ncbi:MAG: hypothetical protein ABOK23_07430 [Candidatus Methanoperedens sp.]|nr:hypothetical protein [Candidatus Methanoperedens sp.]MCZ7396191.1 hypothetical protein [Candidatus Methanoperedens sp.]